MSEQDLENRLHTVRELENKYIQCCRIAKLGDNTIQAFDEWIEAVITLLGEYYPANHTDLIWIKDQDYIVGGYDLYKLYKEIKPKIHFMLGDIATGSIQPLKKVTVDNTIMVKKKPLVFISHNSSQEPFVTDLVNLLEDCGFTPDNLFCSSVPDFNIGFNHDIVETLKSKFLDYELFVIFVLSTDFFQSAWCMNEVGAAWAMQADYSIIETKYLDENAIDGVINKTKTRVSFKASEQLLSARMIEMRDKLLDFAGLKRVSEVSWLRYYKKFITQINNRESELTVTTTSANEKSAFLATDDIDTVVQKAIDKLGEFTIKELQEVTGVSHRCLLNKINAMVLSGDLEAVGPKTRRRFMVKSHTI